MIRVATLPADKNLSSLSRLLWQANVPHRISEESGQQVIWVADEDGAAIIRRALIAFERGELPDVDTESDQQSRLPRVGALKMLSINPLTLCLIVVCVVIALMTGFGSYVVPVSWFTFTDFDIVAGHPYFMSLGESLTNGEYWRLITPTFLHFSGLHLVFNMMWLLVLGGRIETHLSGRTLLVLVVCTGVISNAIQFIFSMDHPLFGGFSGVVYGLLGFSWIYNRCVPESGLALPGPLVGFMVGWLLICFTGVLEVIGFGDIANAAHTAGLLSGTVFGLSFGLFTQWRSAKREHGQEL